MDLISCDFFRRSPIGPCLINNSTYLIDRVSTEFSPNVRFIYLKAKYWTYWTVFNKCFIPRPYLIDPNSCDFFRKSVLNI